MFKYFQSIKDLLLAYQHTNLLNVIGYYDVEYKGCTDDKKSTISYVFIMARRVVSWSSAKQSIIAFSTIKTEYVVCFKATCHVVLLQNFIHYLRVVDPIERSSKMHCDNFTIVFFSNNLKSSNEAKYINMKFYKMKQKITKAHYYWVYTTHNIIAYPLGKGLPIRLFEEHVSHLRLWGSWYYSGLTGLYAMQ